MKRNIQPEWLDILSPDDPRAIRSRRDLLRVNALMGNHRILSRSLRAATHGFEPKRILDLGAGDGELLLRVARQLPRIGAPVSDPARCQTTAVLLDRNGNITADTLRSFVNLGWRAQFVKADVFDWLPNRCRPGDVILANLFLHHLTMKQLRELFHRAAEQAQMFIAVDPRRGAWPRLASRLLWVVGCNSITRHDALLSVRAGFCGKELSALWAAEGPWELREEKAGLFSHLFIAARKSSVELAADQTR